MYNLRLLKTVDKGLVKGAGEVRKVKMRRQLEVVSQYFFGVYQNQRSLK